MARNEFKRSQSEFCDRAHSHAGADSWGALAALAVASTLVVAVVVSVLTLVEAVVSGSASKLERQSLHAGAADLKFLHRLQRSQSGTSDRKAALEP